MFDRISRSWTLAKASASVLQADKELMVFPMVSAAASLAVLVTFALPMVLVNMERAAEDASGLQAIGAVVAFLFYVAQYFVIFFCNTALVGAAMIRLRGGDPTVKDGFNIAFSRLGPILGYAIISATVGMILRALSRKGGLVGRIAASLVGLAWNLATYLVVPVLAVEDVGPIEAVKRSAAYLKKTWGEQFVGNTGIGLVFGMLSFLVVVLGIGGAVAGAMMQSTPIVVLAVAFTVLGLMAVALVNATLSGIYAAAVYRYATEGNAGSFFPAELVSQSFSRA